MRKKIYGVYNIESSNFSFSDKERAIYHPELCYTHSGMAYYQIAATRLQYWKLRIKFWYVRHKIGSKVRIHKVDD